MAGDSEQRLEEHGQPSGGEPFLIGVSGGTASGKVRGLSWRGPGEPRRWGMGGGGEAPRLSPPRSLPRRARRPHGSAAGPSGRPATCAAAGLRRAGGGGGDGGAGGARCPGGTRCGRTSRRRERGRRGLCPAGGRGSSAAGSPGDTWRGGWWCGGWVQALHPLPGPCCPPPRRGGGGWGGGAGEQRAGLGVARGVCGPGPAGMEAASPPRQNSPSHGFNERFPSVTLSLAVSPTAAGPAADAQGALGANAINKWHFFFNGVGRGRGCPFLANFGVAGVEILQ